MFNKKVWITGEVQAQEYLKKHGYKILDTNVKFSNAEIDIVALCPRRVLVKELTKEYKSGLLIKSSYLATRKQLQDTLVFVEVKARSTTDWGLPQESVTPQKQHHIRRCAETYIKMHGYQETPRRYDIIAIVGENIEHLPSAF